MKKLLILCLSLISFSAMAQNHQFQRWIKYEEALKSSRPDTVLNLNMSYLNLKTSSGIFFRFKNLKEIDLTGNYIHKIPSKINSLNNLSELKLSQNGYGEYFLRSIQIRKEVFEKADFNKFLQGDTGNVASRMRLYADSLNKIVEERTKNIIQAKKITVKFAKCKYLEALYLSDSEINSLHPSIKKLKKLKELGLDGNRFTAIPKQIPAFTKLEKLFLVNNQIRNLGVNQLNSLKNLQSLNLSGNQITKVEVDFLQARYLKKLNLADNKITEFVVSSDNLNELESLILYKNQLKEASESIYELRNLKHLDFAYNQIIELSPKISQLQELENLYLSYNRIISLPEEIGTLQKLKGLYVHHNQLTSIPVAISRLKDLKVLHINKNEIAYFPNEIIVLSNLEDLNIADNQMKTFNPKIADLSKLRLLYVNNNAMNKESAEYAVYKAMFDSLRQKEVIVND